MSHAKYLPTSDADKVVWLNNFSSKLSLYANQMGISATEVSSVQNDYVSFKYIVNLIDQYYQTYVYLTNYKNMMKFTDGRQALGSLSNLTAISTPPPIGEGGIFDRISLLVKRIKASLNYNDSIGQDLGIIAPSGSTDIATLQPEIKISLNVGRPQLTWKKGITEAMDLFADRNDGQGFIYVGRLLRNTYLDTTIIPDDKRFDEWHYKGIYVIADKQVGLYSLISSVDLKRM